MFVIEYSVWLIKAWQLHKMDQVDIDFSVINSDVRKWIWARSSRIWYSSLPPKAVIKICMYSSWIAVLYWNYLNEIDGLRMFFMKCSGSSGSEIFRLHILVWLHYRFLGVGIGCLRPVNENFVLSCSDIFIFLSWEETRLLALASGHFPSWGSLLESSLLMIRAIPWSPSGLAGQDAYSD